MDITKQHGRSENSRGDLGADDREGKELNLGRQRNPNTGGLSTKTVSLNSSLKAIGSHRWVLSGRVTQQDWVLENKALTLCTSLPDCYLCRSSRWEEKQ